MVHHSGGRFSLLLDISEIINKPDTRASRERSPRRPLFAMTIIIQPPSSNAMKLNAPSILKRLVTDCSGSAGIEYAVLIAIVILSVAAVFWRTSDESLGSFVPVAQALLGDAKCSGTMDGRLIEAAPSPSLTGDLRLINLISISFLCIAVSGWLIERRARIHRQSESNTTNKTAQGRKAEPSSECRSRFSEKRLKILNTLINDNHKLLPSDLKVADLMTTDVKTALPKTTAGELRRLFADNKFRHVLICDEARHLVGVVSDRDLRHVEDTVSADSLMATRPTTVTSDSRVNDAITQLLYGHISSLPVVDEGRLVGIITTTDVVMTLQCTMLAVEQIVVNLRAERKIEFESLVW
jgi:CBS domain-containing protein/Flp pilus assembly pilin Flp